MGDATATLLLQLEQVRAACLNDARSYAKAVPGILNFISADKPLEQRRWGATFLAETFASPLVSPEEKLSIALPALPTVKGYFDNPQEDAVVVVKSAVQVATSIYPIIFRHIVYTPNDAATWQNMATIKSNIFRRTDSSPSGVRICCIKFIQRVIQVQTHGVISDPRRPEQNETSLALVHSHPLLAPPNLEAEASGLLDRLLSVFQETQSDALYLTATLNCLATLVRTRPSIANRIVNAIFSYKPYDAYMTSKKSLPSGTKLLLRSVERTIRIFFTHLSKHNPNPQFQSRVHEYLEALKARRQYLFDDNRKRGHPDDADNAFSDNKRQRLTDEALPAIQYPPLPDGPISLAQLFTLNPDPRVLNFDVSTIPLDVVLRCVEPLLRAVPQNQFNGAITAVRNRWLSRQASQPTAAQTGGMKTDQQGAEDDDDYEAEGPIMAPSAPPFHLPRPPPRSSAENDMDIQYRVNRMFARLREFNDTGTPADTFLKKGIPSSSHVAGSTDDRDSWVILMLRTALRGKIGRMPKAEGYSPDSPYVDSSSKVCIATAVRDGLLRWILENFRRRIDAAALWMNEEYVLKADHEAAGDDVSGVLGEQYERWSLRLIDGMMPYIDANDWKFVTRFYSEIPLVTRQHVERLGRMAQDPDRVGCALKVLQYLILLKPPCRQASLDVVQDMYKNNEAAKQGAVKHLYDHRRDALDEEDRTAMDNARAAKAAAAKPAVPAAPAPATDDAAAPTSAPPEAAAA